MHQNCLRFHNTHLPLPYNSLHNVLPRVTAGVTVSANVCHVVEVSVSGHLTILVVIQCYGTISHT